MNAQRKDLNSSPDMDGEGSARKRVCKACDRCRLKKSKCDGSSPCNRCQADNAICVFGERKKAQDKVYPKGYVEVLEQQQEKLVNAVRDMYHRMEKNEGWPGLPLHKNEKGHPLTHDILERLGCLKLNPEDPDDLFEDSTDQLYRKAEMRQRENSWARIKREENPYPTPAPMQADFSPARSDAADLLPSLRVDPFQVSTQTTPEQQPFGINPAFGLGGPMAYWPPIPTQPTQATVPAAWTYETPQPLNGLGIAHEEMNPCLPTYHDEYIFAAPDFQP